MTQSAASAESKFLSLNPMQFSPVHDFVFKGDRIVFDVKKRLLLRNDPDDALGRTECGDLIREIEIRDSRELIGRHQSIFLLVSPSCNLRCTYCFLNTCGKMSGGKMMSLGTALRALDSVRNAQENVRDFTINIFGGEPLLNKAILPDLLAEIRRIEHDKKIRVSVILVTNLTLMDTETASLLRKFDVTVEVSIDGPREIHDSHRVYTNGKGSFVSAMKGLEILRAYVPPHRIWVRPTITEGVSVYGVFSYLLDDGFHKISLGSCTESGKLNLSAADFINGLDRVMGKYVSLLKDGYPVVISPLDMYLRKIYDFLGRNAQEMYLDCGAGMDMIAVAPDGGIYPCPSMWGRKNREHVLLGNIGDEFNMHHRFITESACGTDDLPCRVCWGLPFCDGGCKMHTHRPSLCRMSETYHPYLWQLCLYWYAVLRDESPEVLLDIIRPMKKSVFPTIN